MDLIPWTTVTELMTGDPVNRVLTNILLASILLSTWGLKSAVKTQKKDVDDLKTMALAHDRADENRFGKLEYGLSQLKRSK